MRREEEGNPSSNREYVLKEKCGGWIQKRMSLKIIKKKRQEVARRKENK